MPSTSTEDEARPLLQMHPSNPISQSPYQETNTDYGLTQKDPYLTNLAECSDSIEFKEWYVLKLNISKVCLN